MLFRSEEERRKIKTVGAVTGGISVLAIGGIFGRAIFAGGLRVPDTAAPLPEGGTAPLGRLLFTTYALPFEVLSILLLVAMVGVILLSKQDLK